MPVRALDPVKNERSKTHHNGMEWNAIDDRENNIVLVLLAVAVKVNLLV